MPQSCPQPIICIAVIFSTLMAGDSSVVPCPWHLAPISGHCAQLASQGLLPSRAGPPWPSPWKAGITLELGASRCGWAHVVQSPAAQMGRTVKARGTWATSPSGGSPSGVSPDREQGHLREGSGGSEAPCRCHSCSVLISSGQRNRRGWRPAPEGLDPGPVHQLWVPRASVSPPCGGGCPRPRLPCWPTRSGTWAMRTSVAAAS